MDFITGFLLCANGCNAIFTCVDHLTKYTVLTACSLGAGELSANSLHNCFSRVLSNSLACLTIWSITGTHVLLQSSRLNFGTPFDLVQSLASLTIPKLMFRLRDNTEHWSKLLDVYWQSSPYLNQNGVTCCVMLNLPSIQQWQRALGTFHLSWCIGTG